MDAPPHNNLTFTLTLSNLTDSILWRDDVVLDDTPPAFPSKIMPLSTQLITLKGNPQLPQSINIDYNIRKTIFSTQAVYTNYRQTVHIKTAFEYTHRKRLNHRPPKVEFFWEHHALSVGEVPIYSQSFLEAKSDSFPYNYNVLAVIMER
ncbi:hypothetical protein HK44_019890 [Pseudomonas fluorescens HK44]|uniref:Uncharacterized protein n=1 Tax=Pseudomonas fluorescens HK44 TaxID=1042209 RepID=A0A010RPY1_PSEFL|nr:hypothetical protein [Pseudomonas fluorescens]EXF91144.1 hypothetical protein HK44_019890 [Pseudomonas fluorescens HK44]